MAIGDARRTRVHRFPARWLAIAVAVAVAIVLDASAWPASAPAVNGDLAARAGKAKLAAERAIEAAQYRGGPVGVPQVPHLVVTSPTQFPTPVQPSQTVVYEIDVANTGTGDARQAGVVQSLTNLTVQSMSAVCSPGPCRSLPSQVPGTLAVTPLAAGSKASITVTAQVGGAGAFNAGIMAMDYPPERDPSSINVGGDVVASAPPPTPTPALGVHVTLLSGASQEDGGDVVLQAVVTNTGDAPATNVVVDHTPTHLDLRTASGACQVLPCTVQIPAGGSVEVDLEGVVDAGGDAAFSDVVTARADGIDPAQDQASGIIIPTAPPPPVPPPPPPPPQPPWALIVAVLVGLTSLATAIVLVSHAVGHARWMHLVKAFPLPLPDSSTTVGPLRTAVPAIRIRTRIEDGAAAPTGPITYRKVS